MAARRGKKAKPTVAPTSVAPTGESERRARRLLRWIIVGYVFIAALYATTIPLGKGPDETAHLRYFAWLADHHRLPVFSRENPGADYEFHQPPLYYLIALPAYAMSPRGQTAEQTVRFAGIILGIALLYLTFALGRAFAPDHPWVPPAAAAVVAFLPAHLALACTAGNDVLAEVFSAAALLVGVHYLRASSLHRAGQADRPPVGAAVTIGLLIGLGLLSKSPAALLLPVAWAAFALAARGPHGFDWRRLGRDLGACTVVALLVAGWWLVRNQMLYGDPLAQRAFLSAFRDRPSPQQLMQLQHLSLPLYILETAGWTLTSVLGVFGPVYGNRFVFYPYWIYLAFGAKGLAEAVSFLRYLAVGKLADWQRQAWGLSALLGLLLLASFIRFNLSFFQAQARYLFPALPLAAVALCLGLEGLVPRRFSAAALIVGLSLLVTLAVVGLYAWVSPQFQIPIPTAVGGRP